MAAQSPRLQPWLAAGAIIAAVWILYLVLYLPRELRVTGSDSAYYIDCARSIVDGRGFLVRNLFSLAPQEWEPIRLWPPGYPILIAGFLRLGLSPYHAGLAVAAGSATIAALLITYLSVRTFSLSVGLVLATLVISTPSFVAIGTTCWSEAPYLVLVLLSLLCMVRATKDAGISPFWAWFAGFSGGLAWCVRNVGVAVFAASGCYLIGCFLHSRARANVRGAVLWLVGWIGGSGWLVYWTLRTFGRLKPYDMPPSERPLLVNVRDTYHALATELAGARVIGDALTHRYAALMLGTGALLLLAIWLRGKSCRELRSFLYEKRPLLLFGALALFHLGTVIAARTVYRWGEPINARYLSTICWVFWFFLVQIGIGLCSWAGLRRRAVTLLLVLGLCAGTALQIRRQHKMYSWAMQTDSWITKTQLEDLGREIPDHQYVLCDQAAVLDILANVDARCLPETASGSSPLTWQEITNVGDRGLLWGIVISNRAGLWAGKYGETLSHVLSDPDRSSRFQTRDLVNGGLVLRYIRVANPEQ
jgi:4-amino-4-deoxy-L-arabinose transferase-like glycosyltransferase